MPSGESRPVADSDVVAHQNPVWRDRANFLISARIEEGGLPKRVEQLWARRIDERRFEVCCIPFFVYDVSLGDEVETAPIPTIGKQYVVGSVLRPSGHDTFRVWFGPPGSRTGADRLLTDLEACGCLHEWYSAHLLAVDAPPGSAQRVADLLAEREAQGDLAYETGRTAPD
jgi:hypothetical protein